MLIDNEFVLIILHTMYSILKLILHSYNNELQISKKHKKSAIPFFVLSTILTEIPNCIQTHNPLSIYSKFMDSDDLQSPV